MKLPFLRAHYSIVNTTAIEYGSKALKFWEENIENADVNSERCIRINFGYLESGP